MSQIEHLLQTAEAIRSDGKPEWMQVRLPINYIADIVLMFSKVAGLVHDLGKLLLLFGSEGQWDVVGVSPFYFHISYSELTYCTGHFW